MKSTEGWKRPGRRSVIATAQEAVVILGAGGELYDKLKAQNAELQTLAQVAEFTVEPIESLSGAGMVSDRDSWLSGAGE